MLRSRSGILILLVVFLSTTVSAQGFFITTDAGVTFPLGPVSDSGEQIFNFGGGGRVAFGLPLGGSRFVFRPGLSYEYMGLNTTDESGLSLIGISGNFGYLFSLGDRISLLPELGVGYSVGLYSGSTGSTGYAGIELGTMIRFTPGFTMNIGAGYRFFFNLHHGVTISVGTTFRIGRRRSIEIHDVYMDPVYPVLRSYYLDNPVGSLQIENRGGELRNLTASLYVPEYMDQGLDGVPVGVLSPGEITELSLFALFSEDVMNVVAETDVAASIDISWTELGEQKTDSVQTSILIRNRNAHVWDDTRKAASFITPLDPSVLQMAKYSAGIARSIGPPAVNTRFRQSMAIFESIGLYGLQYVVDPDSSYLKLSEDTVSVDYLQFPNQTLLYRGGDCDDLSLLYTALLESVAIETALITVPGHIFSAFALDIPPESAYRLFGRPDDLIVLDDQVWIPVETTLVQNGFLDAWRAGARLWREYSGTGEVELVPVRSAWESFPQTGYRGTAGISMVGLDRLPERYDSVLDQFIQSEIAGREESLLRRTERDSSGRSNNSLGVLYARYGLYQTAEEQFRIAVDSGFRPALINLGHLYFSLGDDSRAIQAYRGALEAHPDNPGLLINLSRSLYRSGGFPESRSLYTRVQDLDPDLAGRYPYLSGADEQSRAMDSGTLEVDEWHEE